MFPTNTEKVVTSDQAALAWHIALESAYEYATLSYPNEGRRLTAGRALLEKGGVQVRGKFLRVESQSTPGLSYDVHATCPCPWFTFGAREGVRRRCAHRWAYLLYACAMDQFLNMYAAVYTSTDNKGHQHVIEGYAIGLPEDSGHLFFHGLDGAHRFLPAPNSNLTLLGKLAWLDEAGVLCGAIPQAVLDLNAA